MNTRILFMGTPEIAATALSALISAGKNIVGVLTREDKPRGRGHNMMPTPVKVLAQENGIPCYEPKTLRDEAFATLLSEIDPELIIVVAYGKILPKNVLDYPRLGALNAHVSLLPKYRGAAPMQRAVMNGEIETGVTVMYMAEGLDTGDIMLTESFPISETDDFESVHDTSARLSGELLLRAIAHLEEGTAPRIPQDDTQASYAEKIEKEDCHIDFTLPARVVSARVRGVTPIPMAFAYQDGKMLKLFRPSVTDGTGTPGEVIATDGKGEGSITVACGEGAIRFTGVIPEGKGRMSAGDFVRGRKINVGEILK